MKCTSIRISDQIAPRSTYVQVFFCTSSTNPLTFRRARVPDYLGSPLRRHVLSTLPDREINLETVKASVTKDNKDQDSFILTERRNPLGELQEAEGHHHWTCM